MGINRKQVPVTCPLCGAPAICNGNSPNGGELYVAEELYSGAECYDPDIYMYKCTDGCNTNFYMEPPNNESN